MSISFCSPPKASKRQEFEEFKDFEERSQEPGGFGTKPSGGKAAIQR